MKYKVGTQWFFPELGYTANAGEVIELDEDVGSRYIQNDPRIINPVGHNTQAKPSVVRTAKPKMTKTRKKK